MGPDELYQLTYGRVCAGVIVRDGVIVATAPVARWTYGRVVGDVARHVARRGGQLVRVTRSGEMAEASQIRLDV